MLKKLFLFAFVIAAVSACKSKDAFQYSQNFVKEEESMSPEMMRTETAIASFLAKEQFDSIAIAGEKMEKTLDMKLDKIINTPAPKVPQAEAFKSAGIKYFTYIKNIYTVYKTFGNAPTPELREKELIKMQELVSQKPRVIAEMQATQKKFAAANNFKIAQ